MVRKEGRGRENFRNGKDDKRERGREMKIRRQKREKGREIWNKAKERRRVNGK